jgi:hypothetical protein
MAYEREEGDKVKNLNLSSVISNRQTCVDQTGSGAHPASYPMNTGISFPGGEAAGSLGWPLTSI